MTQDSTPEDNTTLNDLLPTTPDGQAERLAVLKQLFPDLFTNEGRLNPDELKQLVEPNEVHESERYEFKWYGKAASKREAFTPTTATLVYDEARSINPDKADGNMIIEGENMETLKLLLNAYREQVKCIYIDPPYNTGKDFIYRDNYKKDKANYWEDIGAAENAVQLETNPNTSGRYHSDWLSMMHTRLLGCRQILEKEGVVFISIDDNEIENLLHVSDLVFGSENRISIICWKNVTDNNPTLVNKDSEFIVVYAKDKSSLPDRWKSFRHTGKEILLEKYKELHNRNLTPESIQDEIQRFIAENSSILSGVTRYKFVDVDGIYTGSESVHNPRPGGYEFKVTHPVTHREMRLPACGYRFPEETFRELEKNEKILYGEDEKRIVKIKKYLTEYEDSLRTVIVLDGRLGSYDVKRVFGTRENIFSNPKPVDLLKDLISYSSSDGDIVLDLFSGSGALAQSVLDLHRQYSEKRNFISIQIPEKVDPNTPAGNAAKQAGFDTISEITIERVKRVIEGYGENPQPTPDTGFKVYKLQKSNFPRCEFKPNPEASEVENVAALRRYIDDKESAFFLTLDDKGEQAVFDEVCLKNGFQLHYTRSLREDFTENTVYEISDLRRSALVCLAWNENIHDATIKRLRELAEAEDKPFFICLERALTTTTKWNLKHFLGNHFNAF
jgi:adenine-specific DNA-methyltransferase